jgi:hypothetical protein
MPLSNAMQKAASNANAATNPFVTVAFSRLSCFAHQESINTTSHDNI